MTLSEKFSIAAVVSVLAKFLAAGLSIKLRSFGFTVGTVDATSIAAILTPILGAHHLGAYIAQKGASNDNQK